VARYVGDLRQKFHQHFLGVDFSGGTFSLVDEYFQKLEAVAGEQVEELTRQKAAEAEAEIARLKNEAELNEQQRRAEAETLRGRMVAWQALGQRLREAAERLDELDRAVGGTTPASHPREVDGAPAAS
jgi:hypothetical protein